MKVLVTGGAGFIGINVANHHMERGDDVTIFDNFSRAGTRSNVEWLRSRQTEDLRVIEGDVRDASSLDRSMSHDIDLIYHLAAQVAVTTSVRDPREDFDVNALGTFNVLEATRNKAPDAFLVYASTNKVYGGMESVAIVEDDTRYRYRDLPDGVREDQGLDFHSPYGCSKGAGDQYVRDYARIYGLRTVVFRQSCIYGTRQFGVEDQGWVAHFTISARLGRPITIYGDGKQARDVLWIDDLIAAYDAAYAASEQAAGRIYNIGGGPENTMSIWAEFAPMLERHAGRSIPAEHADWRPGDQPVYVSDISKAAAELGWRPAVGVVEGAELLWHWVDENVGLFSGSDSLQPA